MKTNSAWLSYIEGYVKSSLCFFICCDNSALLQYLLNMVGQWKVFRAVGDTSTHSISHSIPSHSDVGHRQMLQYCVRRCWVRLRLRHQIVIWICKMHNVTCKLQNAKYEMLWKEVGWESLAEPSCPMQNAKCKIWPANCKMQSTKYLAAILHEERLGENLWLRHLAQCKMQNAKCDLQIAKW